MVIETQNNHAIPKGARLPNNQLLTELKNYGMPITDKKADDSVRKPYISDEFLKNLRIQDESDYLQRFKWYNLPEGIDAELLERMFYYRAQLAFFYEPVSDRFMILPYVLNGSIDEYGRYTGVSMLPFNGTANPEANKNGGKKIYIPGEGRTPLYDVVLDDEMSIDVFKNSCVLCNDYCKQMSQIVTPRALLQDQVMKLEAEVYPMARTALISNSGIRVVKYVNANMADNVKFLNQSIYDAALNGDPFLALAGDINTEQLSDINPAKCQEYLMYLESLENQRLSQLGLSNGGIFNKKAYVNETDSAQDLITSNARRQYNDCLTNRQRWCNIINSIWGLMMWCEPSESEAMIDRNGDGEIDNGDNPGQSTESSNDNMEVSENA